MTLGHCYFVMGTGQVRVCTFLQIDNLIWLCCVDLDLRMDLHPTFAHGWLYNTAAAWKDRNYLIRKVTVEWGTEFHYKGEQEFMTARRMKFFVRDYLD